MERPETFSALAETLAECSRDGRTVRVLGGGTKREWGMPQPADVEISTSALDRVVAHNTGDLTTVLQAGVPLAAAAEEFAAARQMLALDPPDPGSATIGGVVATADAGPLRHRYLGVRDLVLGVTVALSDGTIAKSGGTVIKNVAGYDLAKLFTGSFGTLGAILQVAFRLHPLPHRPVTVVASGTDPAEVAECALDLAGMPLEAECLDVSWHGGRGDVLVRIAGVATGARTRRVEEVAGARGLVSTVADDREVWDAQRARQRADGAAICRVSVVPGRIGEVLRAADRLGAGVCGRAGHGIFFLRIDGDDDAAVAAIEEIRSGTDACVVLDAPRVVRDKVGAWGPVEERSLGVMRALKQRFDPAGTFAPGSFVGGI